MRSKFNFGAVIALIVLLVFSYITFLGLVYWKNGEIIMPIVIVTCLILIVVSCVMAMCASKATRWKGTGLAGQIVFGLIILATFLFSAVPFTNFMDVISNQQKIKCEIKTMMISAGELDSSYINYANRRLNNYEDRLKLISKGKKIQPSVYSECLRGAAGNSDDEKINSLVKSLKRKLLPDSIRATQAERRLWLEKSSEMSVWNVKLPSNIAKIAAEVERWTDNYGELSQIIYSGENAQPFTYEPFSTAIEELAANYTQFHRPNLISIIAAIICFAIMLLPYWLTEKSIIGSGEILSHIGRE